MGWMRVQGVVYLIQAGEKPPPGPLSVVVHEHCQHLADGLWEADRRVQAMHLDIEAERCMVCGQPFRPA